MPRWPTGTPAERFWMRADKNGPVPAHRPELGPCWVWTGATDGRDGPDCYGRFPFEGRKGEYTHRIAFFLEHGRWPEPFACHHCDNRLCVRPSHLFEGTSDDNMKDAAEKGRLPQGARHWGAKLTDDDVRVIRVAPGTQQEIADHFGINKERVSRIRSGKAWGHVQ
jgi:hypothetical protein